MHSQNIRSDADLLRGFSGSGITADFESLVARHGPMVLAVSMRTLSNHHDAQDVTQAVFLALAREAANLTDRPSVAGWLHTVSRRLSLDVRRSRESRERREQAFMQESQNTAPDDDLITPFRRELDAAIHHLPDRYRQPLVLCYLEGVSQSAVAQRLNLEPSTLRTRLSRACDMLRRILVRRGVAVSSVGVLTALLATEARAASTAFTPAVLSSLLQCGTSGGACASPYILELSGKAAGAGTAAVTSSISTLLLIMNTKAVLLTAGAVALLTLGISAMINHEPGTGNVGQAVEIPRHKADGPQSDQGIPSGRRSSPAKPKFASIDAAEQALLEFDLSPAFAGTPEEEVQRCIDRLRTLVGSIPIAYYSELATRLGKGADKDLKRTALFKAIYREWGRRDLDAALADLSNIADERTFHKTLEGVLTGAAENDVNKAMKLAVTLEIEPDRINERTRSRLMDAIFDQWIKTDPASALNWALQANAPDQRRQQWITDGLRIWSKQDPESAEKWHQQTGGKVSNPSDAPQK